MRGGIFVGGASSRMGGKPKGLLRAPNGEVLVVRLARIMREAGIEPVLVGRHPEYDALGLDVIEDADAAGPLGGLIGLLDAANGERVIAIACDMPHVTVALVRKLLLSPDAPVVAPRRDHLWEPLFARYDSSRVLALAKERALGRELALQGLLDAAGAVPLELDAEEAALLDDWDTADDVGRNPTLASATVERVVSVASGDGVVSQTDRIAVEEPLEIRVGRDPITVTMRTPGADVDLAAGFLLGEGVLRSQGDVLGIAPAGPHAVVLDLSADALSRLERTERRFWVTSSCGICGKASIDRVRTNVAPLRDDFRLAPAEITRMPGALRSAQSIFDRTGALHAAGLFREGKLVRIAEDVGRHNAVDKVLGAELLAGHVPLERHVLVLSGRVAFELVQKAALAGVPAVVAIGAPTSLAIELAEATNITLVGFARDGRFNVYAGGHRLS